MTLRLNRNQGLGLAALAMALGAVLLAPDWVYSIFMRPDLQRTPVERLIENISAQVEKEPDNTKLLINLARTHGMAYAKKTDELEIEKRKPNEPWFGYLPPRIPFGEVIPLDDAFQRDRQVDDEGLQRAKEAAEKHLQKSIETYRKVLELEPSNATGEIGLAWSLDQAGDSKEAIEIYRKLIARAWPEEKDLEFAGLTFHSIVAEAGMYLMPKLDPEKDKDELANIQSKIEKVNKIIRPVTPIAISLTGESWSNVYDPQAEVFFDADGSGIKKSWTWIRPEAGWLVYDHRREGKITSGLQLFGNVSFWCFWENGYQALAALDDNQDGWLRGTELRRLAVWRDANQNGQSETGEIRPLSAYNIVGLACAAQQAVFSGQTIDYNPWGCELNRGRFLPTYDVQLQRTDVSAASAHPSFAAPAR